MANDFKNAVSQTVGTSRVDIYTAPAVAGKRSMIIGLDIANILNAVVTVDIQLYHTVTGNYIYLAKSVPIQVGGTLSYIAGQKLVLTTSDKIAVTCNTAAGVSVVCSILEDV